MFFFLNTRYNVYNIYNFFSHNEKNYEVKIMQSLKKILIHIMINRKYLTDLKFESKFRKVEYWSQNWSNIFFENTDLEKIIGWVIIRICDRWYLFIFS